jgi:hypothetical protein
MRPKGKAEIQELFIFSLLGTLFRFIFLRFIIFGLGFSLIFDDATELFSLSLALEGAKIIEKMTRKMSENSKVHKNC